MSNNTKSVDLSTHLPVLLFSLSAKISQHAYQKSARPMGLDMSEWRVVQILGQDKSQSINQVADTIAMDRGGISRAISRLEQRGLVERSGDTNDRRRSTVSLTKNGQRMHETIAKFANDRETMLKANLSKAEAEALDGILSKLGEQINSMLKQGTVAANKAR